MKELLKTIFATSKERVSNPIIGSFIISWIIFNWKALSLLLFSKQTIENKIIYIEKEFSDIYHLILLPLIITIIYILIIPYLNLLFEYLLEYSRVKRNKLLISNQKQLIQNNKELAIEELKLEEAKKEFMESKSQNILIDDFQKIIQDKEAQLEIERTRNKELNNKIKEESIFLNNRFNEDRKEFNLRIKKLMDENEILRKQLIETENFYNSTKQFLDKDNMRIAKDGKVWIRREEKEDYEDS